MALVFSRFSLYNTEKVPAKGEKMNVVTLTLNPAFDCHCQGKELRLHQENFVVPLSREAGGKGVNLSRALLAAGRDSRCVVITGQDNEAPFCAALNKDGLRVFAVSVSGSIRENLTVHQEGCPETRISFPGFSVSPQALPLVEQAVGAVDQDSVIAFTGSAPEGLSAEDVTELLLRLKARGARLAVDSRLFSLDELSRLRPWLTKPNREEAARWFSQEIDTPQDAFDVARRLHKSGVENALVSLGKEGAVLCCSQGLFYAKAPAVPVLSTVGAGDSTLAGFLCGAAQALSPQDCLRKAVAFGSAACLTPGSRPPKKEDIGRLEKQVMLFPHKK